MVDTMPHIEFVGWIEYLDSRPIEWRHYSRLYTQIAHNGFVKIKQKPEEMFQELYSVKHGSAKDRKIKSRSWNNSVAAMLGERAGHTWDFLEDKDDSKS